MKYYLIDILRAWRGSREGEEQVWLSVHKDKAEAEKQFDELQHDPYMLGAALTVWTPGINGGELSHTYGSRSCTGGVPKQTVITFAERSYIRHGKKGFVFTLDDWSVSALEKEVTTQPAPGFNILPKKLEEWQKLMMLGFSEYSKDVYNEPEKKAFFALCKKALPMLTEQESLGYLGYELPAHTY